MIRSLSVRRVPRPLAVVLSVALAAVALPVLASPASAAVPTFEFEGNLLVDTPGNLDWANAIAYSDVVNDNAGGDPTVYSTSSKEGDPVSTWTQGSPGTAPPKADIGNVYQFVRLGDDDHIELALGWDRMQGNGTLYYYLELNKLANSPSYRPARSNGDARFTLEDKGNGLIDLAQVDIWTNGAWVAADPVIVGNFRGRVNTAAVDLPTGWDSPAEKKPTDNSIPEEQFYEVGFDLTDLIGLQPGCPPALGTLNFRSSTGETGSEAGENLKDYLTPQPLNAPTSCGKVIVKKNTLPAFDPQAFGLTSTLAGLNGQSIRDTADASGDVVALDVVPGSYTLNETVPAGWDFTSVVCSDPDGGTTANGSAVTLDVDSLETITCTYSNTKRAQLTVAKVTKPGSGTGQAANTTDSFAFTSATPAIGTFALKDTQFSTTTGLVPNQSYSVGEALTNQQIAAGWFLESINCTGGNPETDTATGIANVTLTPGANVTCTYTNTKKGVIEVEKQTDPNGSDDIFTFTTDVPGWTIGGGAGLADGEVDSIKVVPGTYTVTEDVTTGWNLTGIVCNDSNSTGSTATGIATYIVAPGETVRCVYTNTQQGVITVEKQTLPNGSTQDFTFTPSFTIAPGADNILRDGQSFSSVGLAPGQYTVSETVPAGWKALTAADIVCTVTNANGTTTTSGAGSVTIDLKAGAGVNCVFTNTQKARVIVDKVTNPAGSAQTFPLSGSGLPGLPTTISDATSYDSGLIDPGTPASVTEGGTGGTTGWDLTSSECKDQNGVVVGGAKAAQATRSFTPQPGQVITCTYVNTQQAKVVIVKKTDPASQGGTFDFETDVPGFGTDGTVTIVVPNNTPAGVSSTSPFVSVAPAGSDFSVSETAPDGWNVLDLVCVDPDGGTTTDFTAASGTASIDLDPGETVTCTFTNTKLGTLTIGKLTYPPNDPTEFTFDSDASGLDGVALADTGSATSDPLPAGTYTFQEQPTAGWYQDQVVCRDNATGAVVYSDFDDHDTPPLVSINLARGQNVTCTVTNVKYATLQVDKVTNPTGVATQFDFTANGGPSAISEVFKLADADPVKSIKVKPVLSGSDPGYVVAEGTPLPAQWVLTSQVCDNGNAVGNVRPAAGSTVKCTFTNTRSGADLTVAKTATPTYTRTYTWDITKESDATYNLLAGQSVDHDYSVGVTQTYVDSAWKVTGTITVTNPNTYAVTNVSVVDSINNGGVCKVSGQASLLIASIAANGNSGPLGYECTYAAAPNPASGTNTATATWDKTANFTPTGSASGTAPAVFGGPTTEIQPTVTVDDDNLVGENWSANRADASWDYTKTYACSTDLADYTDGKYSYTVVNTATINETGEFAQATVTVNCSTAVVSKTAAGTYDERHEWDVEKTVDPASQDQFAGEDGDYTWTVTVTEESFDENFLVEGAISVRNPSTEAAMTATVTDTLDDGTVATITACTNGTWTAPSTLLVPAGQTASCAYTAAPATKAATKNTVSVTVGGVTSTADAPISWAANVIRGEVDLDDNQNPDLPDTLTEGGTWTYQDFETCSTDSEDYGSDGTYSITDENTATISDESGELDSSTTSTVVNCFAPVVSKTADESFTRTWNWEIVKEKDATYDLIAGGTVTHDYDVTVTPTPVDDFWTVSGAITVENGHPTEVMVLDDVSDLVAGLDGDIAATVDCPSLEVPAAGSLVCTYTTDPQSSPDANPFGDLNTATADFAEADWTGTAPVEFPTEPTTEIDPVVTVDDDLYEGDSEWTADSSEGAWEYSTEYACPVSGSEEYGDTGSYSYTVVNTATVGSGEEELGSDTATVTVNCADGDLVIVKSNTPTGLVPLGSTVTYTLKVGALGALDQPEVVVTDYIPGYDPAVTGSGLMTYVAGSATCDTGAFPCAVAYDAAAKKLTWNIDQINAGETRTLTFQATVDRTQPSIPSGQSGTVTLKNVAAVDSLYTDLVKSNEVQNTANIEIAVLPEVIVKTGVGAPIGPLALVGIVLVGMGVVLTATARRREDTLNEG